MELEEEIDLQVCLPSVADKIVIKINKDITDLNNKVKNLSQC